MAMDLKEIESLIKEAMPDASIEIQDLAGDGNHYSATVTSSEFSGKSKIEQHKMVYNSLKGKMGNELHALAIKMLGKELKYTVIGQPYHNFTLKTNLLVVVI